jgi:hypothetical protein
VLIGDIGFGIGARFGIILIVVAGKVVFSTDVERWNQSLEESP